jgi:hypothetical protein
MAKRLAVLLSSVVFILVAACGGSSSGPATATGQSSSAPKAPASVLGGTFKVDLTYDNFTFGQKCGPNAVTPFTVSYRASADGSNVTFKNLGQGFDMIGTAGSDGTLALAGGFTMPSGVKQTSTLNGPWNKKALDLAATINFEFSGNVCDIKARAKGPVSVTT